MVVDVAVEDFVPVAAAGESDAIASIVERALVRARNNDDAAANAWQPAVEGDDAIVILNMEYVQAFSAQRRMFSAQPTSGRA